MATSPAPLPFRIRADLYAQLAVLEKTGLPVDKAFALLRLPGSVQSRVIKTRASLSRGMGISVSGLRNGLFTELEASLINAATNAGSPAATYRRLGDYYSQRAAQVAAIKSRLALPAFLLIAALLIQPLPALFAETLHFGRYLLHCLQFLGALTGMVYLSLFISDKLGRGPSTPAQRWLQKIVLLMPLFGNICLRRNLRDFFEGLALLLEAGMPILDALPIATVTIHNHVIQSEFSGIKTAIEHGATLKQALAQISYLKESDTISLVYTGEHSGKLPEMLFRYVTIETDAINNFHQQTAVWVPRIIYALIAAWIAYGILNGTGIRPSEI